MKKAFPYILLAVLAVVALSVKRCRRAAENKTSVTENPKKPADEVDRNKDLDRRTSFLEYAEHAKCRMACMHVTQAEVEYILRNGQVNDASSDKAAHPCPVYALDGNAPGKARLRVIFAQCDFKTKVMTCINIDSSFQCQCAGLGSKYDR